MWKKFAARSQERKALQEANLLNVLGESNQSALRALLSDFHSNPNENVITVRKSEDEHRFLKSLCKDLNLKAKLSTRNNEITIFKPFFQNLLKFSPSSKQDVESYFNQNPMKKEELDFLWGKTKRAPGILTPTSAPKPPDRDFSSPQPNFKKFSPPVLPSRKLLPAWLHRDEILEKIRDSEVTIIQGSTGSGKSTQVVQFLLEEGDAKTKILCTQPRRLAAMALASRVAFERGNSAVGQNVGYAVRFDANHGPETQLLFCTTGITLMSLREGLRHGGIFEHVTHLFIDEVHERDRNADFLLIFVREWLLAQRNPEFQGPRIKLVLMSATLKVNSFEKYFSGLSCSNVEIEGRAFPVTPLFLDDVVPIKSIPNPPVAEVNKELVVSLLDKIALGNFKPQVHLQDEDLNANAVLVFLPGWAEIQDLTKLLTSHVKFGDRRKFSILPLHSGIPAREQFQVFARPPDGVMKIVLSTNIAETSLTIEDVAYVIDSGLAKEKGYDANLKSSSLLPTFISQTNIMQRRGRAGRCRPGTCIHLYTKKQFEEFPKYQVPELLRTPLDELCLNARSILSNNASFFKGSSVQNFLCKALDAPPVKSIQSSIQTLIAIGALNPEEQLTGLGKVLCSLPVEPKLGKTILIGSMLSALSPAVTFSVANGFRDPFVFAINPMDKAKLTRSRKELSLSIKELGNSDHSAVWGAFEGFKQTNRGLSKYTYCNERFLSPNVMDSLTSMHRQVLEKLSAKFRDNREAQSKNPAVLASLITCSTFPNLAVLQGSKLSCDPHHKGIRPHVSSSLDFFRGKKSFSKSYLVYDELVRGVNGCDLRVLSKIDPIILALFASSLNVFRSKDLDGFRLEVDEENVDIELNQWLSFSAEKETAEFLGVLRLRFETFFFNAMDRGYFTESDEKFARMLIQILTKHVQDTAASQAVENGEDIEPLSPYPERNPNHQQRRPSSTKRYLST